MNDPLAQYRKKPAGDGSETAPPLSPEGYVAFDGKDRVSRLRIRRANAPSRSPGYAYLLDIVYDGEYGTNFVLFYTYMMVLVKGKNLQHLIIALEMGTADFIQEFDPDRWQKPSDEKAAFIESIVVAVDESGPSIAESEKPGNMKEKGLTRH